MKAIKILLAGVMVLSTIYMAGNEKIYAASASDENKVSTDNCKETSEGEEGEITLEDDKASGFRWVNKVDDSLNAEVIDKGEPDKKGWIQNSDSTWSYYEDGKAVTNHWIKNNGMYYCNNDGIMVTGWFKVYETWYYFNSDGNVADQGWVKDGESWYYVDKGGAMVTGWIKVNHKWYYLKESGEMVTGWLKYGRKWYYFDESGVMVADAVVDGYSLGSDGAWVQ